MDTIYSQSKFDGYTHRFIVRIILENKNDLVFHIYSNSDDYNELSDFIKKRNSYRSMTFAIEHRASKEQDDMCTELINEFLII